MGNFNITGRAYSGGDSAQVVWHVEVTDFYIAAQSPDTLNLRLRPGGQIDFSIDSIRAVGGEENISYQWSTLNLDNGERGDAGREPRATIEFPEEGRYQVDGLAYRGEQSDHVVWNVRVRAGVLDIGNATLDIETGQIARVPVTIFNDEADTLHWEAVANTRGEAGSDPWTLRQRIPISEITSDDRIESVIFDGESYFCAGSNGNDQNMIYHLSEDGRLLGSFPQPGHSRYGFKDLEWDGELIWGSGEDTVFAINFDGDVVHRWAAPYSPTNNIAYDPDENILWLNTTTTDVKAYDRDGNYLDRQINQQGLRIYGLGWFADDPDGASLYALNTPNADTTQINKFNPQTGEMQFVTTIPRDSTGSFNSAFICRNFDQYQGTVLMTVASISPNSGGDQLRVLQLKPNTEWLTVSPESGEIPSGGEADVEIRISTESWNRDWVFEVGEYEGEIVFTHDGQGGQDVLPVHLTVVEPSEVGGGDGYGDPSSFELSAPYPNPFISSATIAFGLDKSAPTRLGIYDLQGRLVEVLISGRLSAGRHSVVWNGADLPAGVYLLRLESGGSVRVTKGVIIK